MRITAGIYKGRTIRTSEGPGYRPATAKVREALFSMLEARGVAWSETRVLDLFAGSGSLAFEALSRGAQHATMVELSRSAARTIEKTVADLGIEPGVAVVECVDIFPWLGKGPGRRAQFDLVFVDPPYGENLTGRALGALDRKGWLAPGAIVVAEIEKNAVVPRAGDAYALDVDRTYGQTRIVLWNRAST
ncbi:16S rRNA (guanine(966)-N(2))-methyltransferase RsmD [Oceanidesulfovibrio indonesiensis]|uniref:16S rRNA (Guanine(966)-N(2))-methyltransferase RsmD n=1 Tax=Oceanidesulfovibrio indonesiensis TaxID=54767 RepID=A0A7M3MKD0_9BACT|nr:16S rRNA (guanine(966)-N(2))-methyltransferase RsmD [Oceanidesulfovibrio indonesiensis]TVM20028.1 16S rRNA (guanine(966)-N(2))-methyltransferase RsmD [Oceanidesulfovibrio indonesiensis]